MNIRSRFAVAASIIALLSLCATAQVGPGGARSPREQYEERERKLIAEIARRPKDAKLYNDLGVVQFYLGKAIAAESSFNRSIQIDPNNADARANLSFQYFQTGRQEAAVELLKEALVIDPNNFLANYFSGLLYFTRQQPTRAEIFLKKALAIQPGNLDVRLDLIKVQAAQKQVAEAERELDRLATELPSDARVRYARATFYAGQGRVADAVNEYKTVLAIAPDSPGIRLEMAVIYLRARDYYNAITMLEEFHKTSVSPESAYMMGHALAELGRLGAAETWLSKAIEGRENFFDAHLQLGRLLFTKRKYEDAKRHLSRAVELSTVELSAAGIKAESVEARYLLGFCLELTNQLDAAMAQYAEIVRLAPNRFEGHHGTGSVKFKRGDNPGALASLFRAAQLNNRDADVQYQLGRALSRAGNNSGAIDHLQQAVALEPNRADARFQLALALRRAGRNDEAAEQMKIVERLNTEFRNRTGGMDKQ
jgi:tetratricopeptide (TPR) repeat protein